MSLRTRLFTVLFVILTGAAIIIWYGIKPSYEDAILEERLTLITEYQQQRIREAEIQLFFWLKITTELRETAASSQLLQSEFDSFGRLFSDLLYLRYTRNTSSTEISTSSFAIPSDLTEQDLQEHLFLVHDEPRLYAGWNTSRSRFHIYMEWEHGSEQILTIFDASKINQIMLQNVLRGNAFSVIWLPDSTVIGRNLTSNFFPIDSPSTSYYTQELPSAKYLTVATPFSTLPLKHTIYVDQSFLQRQVSQLFSQSLIMLIITFLALAAAGHLLISRVQRPINMFLDDVGPFANYDFNTPFRAIDLPELSGIASKMEDIRMRLLHYKKINVEKIILHDHRSRLLMNHAIELVGQFNEKGEFTFLNVQLRELVKSMGISDEIITLDGFLNHHQLHILDKRQEIVTHDHLIITSQSLTLEIDLPDEKTGFYKLLINDITDQDEIRHGGMIILIDQTKDKEVERMRSDMLGLIIHELQNPVNAGLGLTTYLLDEKQIDEKERTEILSMINLSMENIMHLIDRFLKISRLESVNTRIDRIPINFNKMIKPVVDSFKTQLEDKDLKVVINSEPLPYISGSPELLEDVVRNLLSNAIKYGETKRIIYLASWSTQNHIHFSITDHGYGIPEEHMEKVFQKFYRINSYSKERGTGLGLAYVKEIINKHNGTIKIESNPEIGTRFTISLPIDESDIDFVKI